MNKKSCLNCIKNCDVFKILSIEFAYEPAQNRHALYYQLAEICKEYLAGE